MAAGKAVAAAAVVAARGAAHRAAAAAGVVDSKPHRQISKRCSGVGRIASAGFMPGVRGGRGLILLLIIVLGIWLLTGFYRVEPDEQGVVLRWGEWTQTTQPGLNYHLPWPFETVLLPKVTKINRAEIGYRTLVDSNRGAFTRPVPDESLMLTGDENIIDVKFTAFWRIRDAGQYLFNIQAPDRTVRDAAESAMREVIGKTRLQSALAEERFLLAQQTHELTQSILDYYGAGIEVTQIEPQDIGPPDAVIASFRDVQAARADQERAKNEAESYRNDIIPRARGAAETPRAGGHGLQGADRRRGPGRGVALRCGPHRVRAERGCRPPAHVFGDDGGSARRAGQDYHRFGRGGLLRRRALPAPARASTPPGRHAVVGHEHPTQIRHRRRGHPRGHRPAPDLHLQGA